MANEIQAQHEAFDVDEIRILYPSVEATEPQNEPRNKIMYQTAKWLLARRGVRLHEFAIYKYAIYFTGYALFFGQYMYFKDKKEHTLLGIKAMDWNKFCFYTIITIPISAGASFAILSVFESCFLLKKNLLYFRHGLKIKVGAVICFAVALGVWFVHLRPAEHHQTADCVLDTIISLLLGSILWLAKSTLLLIVASSFCFNSFFDRAVESLVHKYVITALSGTAIGSSGPDPAQRERKHNVLVACIRRIIKSVVEFIRGLVKGVFVCVYVALQGHEPHHEVKVDIPELMKVPGDEFPLFTKQLLIEAISGSVSWTFQENGPRFMNNEQGASEAAPLIFRNVAKPGNSFIELEDLKRFLTDDILDVMLPMIEVDKNGRITLQSFSTWMVKTYNFRMVLKRAVANSKMLFNRLKIVSDGLLILGIILLWLGLTKIAKWKIMIIIFTQIAAGAFIFGDSVKKKFEGAVFLFAVHPFDVGDCCVVGDIPVVIEHKSILTTTVKKFNTQLMYYPNSVLATLPISNYTRNPHMADSLEFSIDLMTPEEKIEQLKHKIKRYLEDNAHYWQPGHSLVTKEIDGMDKMKMVLNFNHTIRFREFVVRDERKFELIMELRKIFKELKLKTEVNLS